MGVLLLAARCAREVQARRWGLTHRVCYLCITKVALSEWDEHRGPCALASSELLQRLPPHPGLKCAKCGGRLLLWPQGRGPDFTCDQRDVLVCKGGAGEMASTGANRYNCFPCDWDACTNCANKEAELLDRQRSRRGTLVIRSRTTSRTASRACSRNTSRRNSRDFGRDPSSSSLLPEGHRRLLNGPGGQVSRGPGC